MAMNKLNGLTENQVDLLIYGLNKTIDEEELSPLDQVDTSYLLMQLLEIRKYLNKE